MSTSGYSLTTMGCPIGPMIEDQMRAFLAFPRPVSARSDPDLVSSAHRGARS